MTNDGSGEWFPMPEESRGAAASGSAGSLRERVDSLLPADSETGVAEFEAIRTYLGAFMDLMIRHGQPLALMMLAPDPNETTHILGSEGAALIRAAVARCLLQETRVHDAIGCAASDGVNGTPAFLLVLPLMTESGVRQFAERLLNAMTTSTGGEGRPWLTLSAGIASLSLDTDTPDKLINKAQEALDQAQRAGGGQIWSHAGSVQQMAGQDTGRYEQE